MATTSTTKLVINYLSSQGKSIIHTWNYASPSVQASDVQALAQATIDNNSIFASPPATVKSANLVKTEKTEVDLGL